MRCAAWMLGVVVGAGVIARGAAGEASLRFELPLDRVIDGAVDGRVAREGVDGVVTGGTPVSRDGVDSERGMEFTGRAVAALSFAPALGSVGEDSAGKPAYGEEGGRFWAIGAGITHDFADATDTNIFFSYHYFLADGVEFVGEVGAWYYNQPGDDAFALNPAMVFRWHFLRREDWTLYADMGIGLLFASDNVPEGGTSFDFTPRVGVGMTYEIDWDTRFLVGLRWAHVSNARIYGNDQNPSRDGPMLYAGVIFRF